jgi:two-component system chemotaxis response regulator CheB
MTSFAKPIDAVVIGTSAGGLQALHVVLRGLAWDLRIPVIIVCHTGSSDMNTFCELLEPSSRLPVLEACERLRPQPGCVYVAPSGYHLLVEVDSQFSLSIDEKVRFSRPSIDVLFESAARCWRSRLAGVVLTGANQDGACGLRLVRELGGIAIVQDPQSAEAPAMPTAALEIAGADYCVALPDIGPLINQLSLQ